MIAKIVVFIAVVGIMIIDTISVTIGIIHSEIVATTNITMIVTFLYSYISVLFV